MSVILNMRLPDELNDRLRAWATSNGLLVSQAARMLIEDKLNDLSGELPKEEAWRRTCLNEVKMAETGRVAKAFNELIHKLKGE